MLQIGSLREARNKIVHCRVDLELGQHAFCDQLRIATRVDLGLGQ